MEIGVLFQNSKTVAYVTEIGLLSMLPNKTVQNRVLKPFRYHAGGTITVRVYIIPLPCWGYYDGKSIIPLPHCKNINSITSLGFIRSYLSVGEYL